MTGFWCGRAFIMSSFRDGLAFCHSGSTLHFVIPGRRASGEPGIQMQAQPVDLDSGFALSARPGMTGFWRGRALIIIPGRPCILSFRGAAIAANPESRRTHRAVSGFRVRVLRTRPGNDGLVWVPRP
ncbi:MAG TPA: hypothetical protein VFB23_04905 [Candidatus Acidoferrales bacterium]|nr:hypothetical protein [Candidatus Acidoferrales bacterium]